MPHIFSKTDEVRLLQFLAQIVPQFRASALNFGSHASDDSFVGGQACSGQSL
jgi:hypothetical protein